MKPYLFVLFLSAQTAYCQQDGSGFVVLGHVVNTDTLQKAMLINTVSGKKDTVDVKQGRFTIKGRVDYPCLGLISVDKRVLGSSLWLSNDTISIDFNALKQDTGPIFLEITQVKSPQSAIDEHIFYEKLGQLYAQKQYQQISDEMREYVGQHRDSYYAVHLIGVYINQLGPDLADELLATMTSQVRQGRDAVVLKSRINTLKMNALGKTIDDFILPDNTNHLQRLSTLVKPYTLIHFWASWCKPCREHSPELVSIYQTTDSRKLQMIGISVDEKRQAWVNAILKDKFQWVQLADLKGFDGDVVKGFSLTSIPYTILIDQNRRVLATTLAEAKIILDSK